MRDIDAVTGEVVEAAYRLHRRRGPGLLEVVYEAMLERKLLESGLKVRRQQPVTFELDGVRFEEGFRVDLLVEDRVIVEVKSLEKLAPVHARQVLTYLRLPELPVGLLINFGAATMKDGLRRIVNDYTPDPNARLRVNRHRHHRA